LIHLLLLLVGVLSCLVFSCLFLGGKLLNAEAISGMMITALRTMEELEKERADHSGNFIFIMIFL
jgi:hypothetical protein